MTLREKTVNGLVWSFIGDGVNKGIIFVVGIILARILSPDEYGLVAIVTIFISISGPLINSGFSQALIRKKGVTESDYSTVFYFNLIVGFLLYGLLFILAPQISKYFHDEQLIKLTRLCGVLILINASTIIQSTIFTKEMKFKLQSLITVISSALSGILGIVLALKGFGVYSLVYKMIVLSILQSVLLWYFSTWRPEKSFSIQSFKEMFGFGSRLLITGIIDKIYGEIYNLVIARKFSTADLGLYTRADMFKKLVSSNITEIISKVSFPALSKVNESPNKLKDAYIKIFSSTMLINIVLLVGMAGCAETLVLGLLGKKWEGTVLFLQLLCVVGVFYPILAFSRTILYVYGKGSWVLRLEIFSKLLAIPAIIAGIMWGIPYLILVMIIATIIESIVKSLIIGKLISFSFIDQTRIILPFMFIALLNGAMLFLLGYISSLEAIYTLLLQILAGSIFVILVLEISKLPAYLFLKDSVRVLFKLEENK